MPSVAWRRRESSGSVPPSRRTARRRYGPRCARRSASPPGRCRPHRSMTGGPGAATRPLVIALSLFALTFGVYAVTMGQLRGYEPETAAVTEGFVRTGHFQLLRRSPLRSEGHAGAGEHLVGRAGLPQPLLEAPFYVAGWAVDGFGRTNNGYGGRSVALLFYNPFAMALVVALVFGIVLLIRRSARWGVAVALLVAFATVAWPYSKIGMETTLTLALALFVFAALHAARTMSWRWWALTGFAAGMAFAVKPYAAPVMLPALAV